MGKCQILSNLGDGQFSVKLLLNRDYADKQLALLDKAILINQDKQNEIELSGSDPKKQLPELKLCMESLLKQKEILSHIPEDLTRTVWGVDYDYSNVPTGVAGTIEINGDTETVLLQPSFENVRKFGAHYEEAIDGQLQSSIAMTPAQWFYNAAMKPGWQKWNPTYRLGIITAKTNSMCSVTLDDANCEITNMGPGPTINANTFLTNVPIRYLDCDGTVFSVGDRVVVSFANQSPDYPEVIGFEDNPTGADMGLVAIISYTIGEPKRYYIGAFDMTGALISTLDLHDIMGTNPEYAIQIMACSEAANSVYVKSLGWLWTKNFYTNIFEWIQTPVLYRIPIAWNYANQYFGETGSCPTSWYNTNTPGCLGSVLTHVAVSVGGYLFISYGDSGVSPYSDLIYNGCGAYIYAFPSSIEPRKNDFSVVKTFMSYHPEYENLPPGQFVYYQGDYPADGYQHVDTISAACFDGNKFYCFRASGYDPDTDPVYCHPEQPYSRTFRGVVEWQYPPYEPRAPIFPSSWQDDVKPYFYCTGGANEWCDPSFYQFRKDTSVLVTDISPSQIMMIDGSMFCFEDHKCYRNPGGSFYQRGDVFYYPSICDFQSATIIRNFGNKYLALRFYNNNSIYIMDILDPVGVYDLEAGKYVSWTWNLLTTITLSLDEAQLGVQNFVVANIPLCNMALDLFNAFRAKYGVYAVSYSRELSAVAQDHAEWCVDHERASHDGAQQPIPDDPNGFYGTSSTPKQRGQSAGFMNATEVLATVISKKRQYDDWVTAIAGWEGSPGHRDTIIHPSHVMMGYGIATFPPTCTGIVRGAGTYDEETKTYNTEEWTQVLSSSSLGHVKMIVVMFCPC